MGPGPLAGQDLAPIGLAVPPEGLKPTEGRGGPERGAGPVPAGLGALRGRACLTKPTNHRVWNEQT